MRLIQKNETERVFYSDFDSAGTLKFKNVAKSSIDNMNGWMYFRIDIIQDECSVRFTLSFHAHFEQMQRIYQKINITSPSIFEVASSNFFHS